MRNLIGLMLILVCSAAMAAGPSRITMQNFNKIKLGDTETWVTRCLGPATGSKWESADSKCLEWTKPQYVLVLITFEEGKVVRKAQANLR